MKYTIQYVKDNPQLPLFGFWGSYNESEQERCLSNFYPTRIRLLDSLFEDDDSLMVEFESSEQAFMYMKAILFEDLDIAKRILEGGHKPQYYKKLGRQVKGFDQSVWNTWKASIMRTICLNKFSQNETLKQHLLSTEDAILVETNPFDSVWGIGLAKQDRYGNKQTDWLNVNKWKGQNLLGFTLMDVRDELRREREREKG